MTRCGWIQLLALWTGTTLLLLIAMLSWLPESSRLRGIPSHHPPSGPHPEIEAARQDKAVALDRLDNPFAMYQLPSQLASLPFPRRLQLANVALQYIYRPVPLTVLQYLEQRSHLPFTQRHPQQLYSRDVFELVRYRWAVHPRLNHSLTLQELMQRVEEESRGKGEWWRYQYSYPHFDPPLDNTTTVDYKATPVINATVDLREALRQWNLSTVDARPDQDLSRSQVYLYSQRYLDDCFLRNISLKYLPHCPEDQRLNRRWVRPLLVTAVQRSGKAPSSFYLCTMQ